jgi:hypothetical protein
VVRAAVVRALALTMCAFFSVAPIAGGAIGASGVSGPATGQTAPYTPETAESEGRCGSPELAGGKYRRADRPHCGKQPPAALFLRAAPDFPGTALPPSRSPAPVRSGDFPIRLQVFRR